MADYKKMFFSILKNSQSGKRQDPISELDFSIPDPGLGFSIPDTGPGFFHSGSGSATLNLQRIEVFLT
jgi:hypothetical protein